MKFKKENLNTLLIVGAIVLTSGAIFFLAIFLFLELFYSSKVFPRVKVAGIEIQNKTKEEVRELLTAKTQEWSEMPMVLYFEDRVEISKEELEIDFNIEETVSKVYETGRSGNFYRQALDRLSILFTGENLSITVSGGAINSRIEEISQEFNIDGINLGLSVSDGGIIETEAKSGKEVRQYKLKALILEQIGSLRNDELKIPFKRIYPSTDLTKVDEIKEELKGFMESSLVLRDGSSSWTIDSEQIGEWLSVNSKTYSLVRLDPYAYNLTRYINKFIDQSGLMGFVGGELESSLKESELNEYLGNIAKDIDIEAKNAQLSVVAGEAVIEANDINGRKLNIDNARRGIVYALRNNKNTVDLSVDTVRAQVRKDNIDKLGIKQLISQGKSDFSNSSSARIHNIKVGALKFDGLLIAPGEEFSFNKYLGPVDASGGFLPELVIKPGKLVKEYGGGLCQVATTTFRAALYSGLPVTERKNHSFVVSHYFWPFSVAGTDATIYPPHPDLRFTNDTGNYILIQTYSMGNILYFDFYGDIGDRKSTIEGPTVVSRGDDGSLITVFYRNVYNGDNLKRKDTFKSYYKPSEDFERDTEEDEG